MEIRKLNQSSLNQICYILGSYDFEIKSLEYSEKNVWIILDHSECFLPLYCLKEIEEIMVEFYGVCLIDSCLALLFDRENPDEILTIPVIDIEKFVSE